MATENEQPSQEAIDFLFQMKMEGKITEAIQKNEEVQLMLSDLCEDRAAWREKAKVLDKEVDELEDKIDDLKQEVEEAESNASSYERMYDEVKEELEEFDDARTLPASTLQDTMKNAILIRFANQLSLQDIEYIEGIVIRDQIINYNPHL
jgi:uncharacterized coiled-coil DUF342 family protein